MSTVVEDRQPGDWLIQEADGYFSRKTRTVLSGEVMKSGQVFALDANSKVFALDATGNEVHTLTPDGTATAGTWRAVLWHRSGYWVETADIAYNAATGTIDTAFNAVLGTSAIASGGTIFSAGTGGLTVTFSGTNYASLAQPFGFVKCENLTGTTAVTFTRSTSAGAARNEVQTITLSGAMTAGTYPLTIFTPTGVPLVIDVAWNTNWATTMADINTAITAAATAWYGGASVGAVMTGDATAQVLTYSGVGFTGKAVALAQVATNGITGATSASIVRTTSGGKAGNRVGMQAAGILLEDCDASAGDVTNQVTIERDAIVNADALVYGGGDPDDTVVALEALRITAKTAAAIKEIGF